MTKTTPWREVEASLKHSSAENARGGVGLRLGKGQFNVKVVLGRVSVRIGVEASLKHSSAENARWMVKVGKSEG